MVNHKYGMLQRKRREQLAGLYKHIYSDNICVYCGEYADTRDHVVPVSVAAIAEVDEHEKLTVAACRECNSIAHNADFHTIGAKRRYIQSRLYEKYREYLELPHWTMNELEELGWSLRVMIEGTMQIQQRTIRRLRWRIVTGVESPSRKNGIGKGSVRVSARNNFNQTSLSERERHLLSSYAVDL